MRSPIYMIRCILCETFIGWANAVAPENYESSIIKASCQLVLKERKFWTSFMHKLAVAGVLRAEDVADAAAKHS